MIDYIKFFTFGFSDALLLDVNLTLLTMGSTCGISDGWCSLACEAFLACWGPFLEGPEKVSHQKSHSKISNLTITELFYSHILNMNRGSPLTRIKFQAYTLLRF